jgi:hypothetical protein
MTILTVVVGWLLALKLNYCISGNKYEGSDDGEADSKKYQSMESGRAGYKRKTTKDIPRRREGSMVLCLADGFSACRAEN